MNVDETKLPKSHRDTLAVLRRGTYKMTGYTAHQVEARCRGSYGPGVDAAGVLEDLTRAGLAVLAPSRGQRQPKRWRARPHDRA